MFKFILSGIIFFFSISAKSQSTGAGLFNVDPTLFDAGFTYLVFPFNPVFVKEQKVKTICYTLKHSDTRFCWEFDRNGNQTKRHNITIDKKTRKTHKIMLEDRIYSNKTGLLDTLIEFDEIRGTADVYCYGYDEQKRKTKILKYLFAEQGRDSWLTMKIPAYLREPGEEWASKESVNGRPVDRNAFLVMTKNNDFSSIRYEYFHDIDSTDIMQEKELYDFNKKYKKTDTCQRLSLTYFRKNQPYLTARKYLCNEAVDPEDYYYKKNKIARNIFFERIFRYANGRLDSILTVERNGISAIKDVAFNYDEKNNFTGIINITSGKPVSILFMTYNEKGLVTTLKRRSSFGYSNHYMDDDLTFTYTFY